MGTQLKLRKSSMVWTDQRAKVLVEVFSTMRVVKYFSYEGPFLAREYPIYYPMSLPAVFLNDLL